MGCTWLLAALAVVLSLSRSRGVSLRQTAVFVGIGTLASISTLSPGLAGWFVGLGLAHKQLPRPLRMPALLLGSVGTLLMFLATIVLLRPVPQGLQIELAPRVWVWKAPRRRPRKRQALELVSQFNRPITHGLLHQACRKFSQTLTICI